MKQKTAIESISKYVIENKNVDAIFIKGDLADKEYDEHSIIELYLVVDRANLDFVLDRRFEYLESYKPIIHYFFMFFSCPQIVAVYEDGTRINLFVSTLDNLKIYGNTLIIYDPKNILEKMKKFDYTLSAKDAAEYFNTFNYTLLDFRTAYLRNDIPYAFRLANHLFSDFSTIIRTVCDPQNAKVGLKGLFKVLEYDLKEKYYQVIREFKYDNLLPTVVLMISVVDNLIMRMPLEIAQYINYDFHIYCKKQILTIV